MLKQSTECLQILQRPNVSKCHISCCLVFISETIPSAIFSPPSGEVRKVVASSIAAGRVIKGLATAALRKHLGLAASDEGLRQQQPAGCDVAMKALVLILVW